MKKPELIAPAGDLEKLKIAFMYGADSVYASTPKFSMRTREIGFNEKTLKEGIAYAHSIGKKVYLTLNVFSHASEIENMKKYAKRVVRFNPDAIIVADPGAVKFIQSITDIPVHLSTQANTTNHLSAEFWREQGVNRIVLARELSLKDIKTISQKSKIDIEAFVHGAMCMAYSGRCQISNYLTGRDANKGACIQACRFKYKMYGLEEDLRPGEIFPIEEDEKGSYILNSKDLCMIDHIPELIDAGIKSFKIEGRLKSIYYVAVVTRAYRKAIDLYFDNDSEYKKEKTKFKNEVKKSSNREYTTGFYFNKPNQNTNNYKTSRVINDWDFVALVKKYDKTNKLVMAEGRNKLSIGDNIEIVTPDKVYKTKLKELIHKKKSVENVHAGYEFSFAFGRELPENSFIRKRVK